MADRAPEPPAGGERELLLGWLAFHRDALAAKCDGMSAEQLVTMAAPPSDLSLLGLVRHLTEMERVYLVRALAGGELRLIYCTDAAPDGDIVGLTPGLSLASVERRRDRRVGGSPPSCGQPWVTPGPCSTSGPGPGPMSRPTGT
jgi:hypothetical protein